jgi:hypothetical protein
MQHPEPVKAEQARLEESRAQGRRIQKHSDWERQVRLLEQGDEGVRLDIFFEILVKRLDLPTAGMQSGDYPEWAVEHGEALSFLYHEPHLPEACGASGAFTKDIRRLTALLLQSDVSLTPQDVTGHLRSQLEEVPVEIAKLRSVCKGLKGWFIAYAAISLCFFALLVVCCLGLFGLTVMDQSGLSEPSPAVGATTIESLILGCGALGTLFVAILLGLRWKKKEAELQKRQCELQETRVILGHEANRLQAEALQSYHLAISAASRLRERLLQDLVKAVDTWRSTVRNEFVKDFFEQGLWVRDRFAERLKALLLEIERHFPASCRVEIDSLSENHIESAFDVLTAVIASMIAAKVELGRSATLAQLIVSGNEPDVPMPPATVVLERLESERVLLKGDQLSDDTKSCMTEVLQTLRA